MYLVQRTGQTLLEAIIAIAIILSAVIGSSTLILTSITAGRISQNRVEAANFAREGVEAVRAIRDSNWLKFQQNETVFPGDPTSLYTWNQGLSDGSFRIFYSYGSTNRWVLQSCGACTTALTLIYRVVYTDAPNSIVRNWFSQYSTPAICNSSGRVCVPTKYSRTITITSVAEDVNIDGDTDDLEDVYLLVASTVSWNDRTGVKSLTAQARLYDWK